MADQDYRADLDLRATYLWAFATFSSAGSSSFPNLPTPLPPPPTREELVDLMMRGTETAQRLDCQATQLTPTDTSLPVSLKTRRLIEPDRS